MTISTPSSGTLILVPDKWCVCFALSSSGMQKKNQSQEARREKGDNRLAANI
jgi:hypothetical protein